MYSYSERFTGSVEFAFITIWWAKSCCQGNVEQNISRGARFAATFAANYIDQAGDKRTSIAALVPHHGERTRSFSSRQCAINNFVTLVGSRSHFRTQRHALAESHELLHGQELRAPAGHRRSTALPVAESNHLGPQTVNFTQ